MKKAKILEAFRFINGIKLNVVEDKETRSAIISNHLKMYKIVENHEAEVRKVYEKFFEGKTEEVQKLYNLRNEFNSDATDDRKKEIVEEIMKDYSDIIKLEGEFNETYNNMLDEDIDLSVVKLNQEPFISACVDSGIDFSMAEIIKLDDLFKDDE